MYLIKLKSTLQFICGVIFVLGVFCLAFYLSTQNKESAALPPSTPIPFTVSTTATTSSIKEGTIVSVTDGDTMKVKIDGKVETVRLLLIDTPETHHPTKPVQPFGKEAEDYARRTLVPGAVVGVEVGNPERDIYDRLLAYLWVDKETFNEMQIKNGYARVAYVFPPNDKYIKQFRETEEKAKSIGFGIWSLQDYVHDNGFYLTK